MKFIKLRCHPRVLNNAEDKMIYINGDCIRSIRQVTYDSTWTVINYVGLDDKCICVLETPEEILGLLKDESTNMQMNMSFPDIFGDKK